MSMIKLSQIPEVKIYKSFSELFDKVKENLVKLHKLSAEKSFKKAKPMR